MSDEEERQGQQEVVALDGGRRGEKSIDLRAVILDAIKQGRTVFVVVRVEYVMDDAWEDLARLHYEPIAVSEDRSFSENELRRASADLQLSTRVVLVELKKEDAPLLGRVPWV